MRSTGVSFFSRSSFRFSALAGRSCAAAHPATVIRNTKKNVFIRHPPERPQNVTHGGRALRHHRPLMKRILLLLMIMVTVSAAADRRRAVRSPRLYPPCAMVTGASSITFTYDGGRTLAPAAVPLRGLTYTYGLA